MLKCKNFTSLCVYNLRITLTIFGLHHANLNILFHDEPASCRSGQRHRYRCGRFAVRFPGRSNQTQCRQSLANAATFFRSCVSPALCRGDGPRHLLVATPLRRNTASVMKIYLFFLFCLLNFSNPGIPTVFSKMLV